MVNTANHIDVEELSAYIANKADRDQTARIKRHVALCETCGDMLVTGLLQRIGSLKRREPGGSRAEKRVSERLNIDGNGYLQSIYPLSFERPEAQIIDSSESGLGLLTNSSFAAAAIVQICIGTEVKYGVVMSCVATGDDQFRVGILVQPLETIQARRQAELSRKAEKQSGKIEKYRTIAAG